MQRIIDTLTITQQVNKNNQKPLPPIHLWQPDKIIDNDMLIDAQGRWLHEGSVIERIELCQLFASILRKEGDEYFLITPREKFPIIVQDVPFLFVSVLREEVDSQSVLIFSTSLNETVVLNNQQQFELRDYAGVDLPYISLRDDLYGKLSRSCYYHLLEYAEVENTDDQQTYSVRSGGETYFLGATKLE